MFHVSCFVVHGLWLRNQEPPNLSPTKLGLRIWDDPRNTLKSHQISCQTGMQLSQENWSQATKIMKNRRWHRCKSWFLLIHPLPKYVLGFPIPDIQIQIPKSSGRTTWKQLWKNRLVLLQRYPKTAKMDRLNQRNLFVLPNALGSSKDRPRVPQDVKVGAPNLQWASLMKETSTRKHRLD